MIGIICPDSGHNPIASEMFIHASSSQAIAAKGDTNANERRG
jgi:hypothetical protein